MPRTTVQIPEDFLKLATEEGLSVKDAENLYVLKTNKKRVDDLALSLSLQGIYSSQRKAKDGIRRIWSNWSTRFSTQTVTDPEGNVKQVPTVNVVSKRKRINKKTYLDAAAENLEKLIGELKFPKTNLNRTAKGRIAIAGDFHIPFVEPKAVEVLLNDPAETLWVNGDLLDVFSLSKYKKETDALSLQDELSAGRALLEQLSKNFKHVKMVAGNHEQRGAKRVQEILPQLMPLLIGPLELLSYGLDNVEVVKTTIPDTKPLVRIERDIELDFFGMEGDTVVGHFSFAGKMAHEQALKWLDQWRHVLKLKREPKVIIQNHTHRLLVHFEPNGRVLIHGGSMCKPMGYMFDNQGIYPPPTPGYIALYQDKKGNTDIKNIQVIPCI